MAAINAVTFSDEIVGRAAHTHRNVHQLVFALSGKLRVTIASRQYFVDRPSAIFISHLEPHAISVEGREYRRFCIDLDPEEIERDIKSAKLLSILSNRPENFSHIVDIEALLSRLQPFLVELKEQFDRKDDEFYENTTAILKSILIMLYHHAPDAFPHEENNISAAVQAIKQRIECNLAHDETLDELAAHFHISRYYLAHCYKQITGYSIKNYRLLCRIAAARELLVSTTLSVSDICDRIGFSNMSNFSRYFKKEVGLSPLKYRALHKNI